VQVVGVPEQERQLVLQLTQELLNSMAVLAQEVHVLGLPEHEEHVEEHTWQVLSLISWSGRVQEVQ